MKKQLSILPTIAILLAAAFTVSCATGKFETRKIDAKYEYKSYKDKIFLAPQPTPKQLKTLKDNEGVEVVINLRSREEIRRLKFNPKYAATKIGMTYYNIPFLKNGNPDKKSIKKIEEVFMKHHKKPQKVLVYCSSGNRAGAWLATHFADAHKTSTAKSLEYGRKGGLTSKDLQAKMIPFLKDNY